VAILNGTPENDLIEGTLEADEITALAGDDTVFGDDENDVIDGGEGNDTIFGGIGSDVPVSNLEDQDIINGGLGDDLIYGNQGNDILNGDDGNDTLFGGKDNDSVNGGDGNDVIIGDLGDDAIGETVPLDVVLLQDLSGSFNDDLPIIEEIIPEVFGSVQETSPNSQFGIASFVDKPINPFGRDFAGDYVYQTDQVLTTDTNQLSSIISSLDIRNGGNFDASEAQLEGLLQIANRTDELGFRDNSRQIVVLSTDAPFHVAGDGVEAGITTPNNGDAVLDGDPAGTGEDYPSIEQVRNALNTSNITPIFAVTSDQIETYEELVDELGRGTVVQLSSDSSNLVEAVTEGLGEVLVEDTLTGGAGNDQFIFYRSDDQVDRITDFEPDNDQIVVSASNFGGGLIPGDISEEQFVIGTVAEDESDRFIYNDQTGSLFFDPDGTGSAPAVQLVTLDNNPALSATDLLAI
jgi:Ca2+-binding RTX toxin-like protein